MMRSYSFLSFGFACLATALLVIGILAMPSQGVWANDPVGGGPLAVACASDCSCDNYPTCLDKCSDGGGCDTECGCQPYADAEECVCLHICELTSAVLTA